jgi:hypothetical protein
MQLSCLYHAKHPMRVLDDETEFNRLIASGEWFNHPSLTNRGSQYEKPRLHTSRRKRRINHEQASNDGGDAT